MEIILNEAQAQNSVKGLDFRFAMLLLQKHAVTHFCYSAFVVVLICFHKFFCTAPMGDFWPPWEVMAVEYGI